MRESNKMQSINKLVFKKWNRKGYSVFNSLNKIIKITALSLSYSIVVISSDAIAQTDTTVTKNIDLDEVIVSAQKAPVVYSQLSRLVTVIKQDDIELIPASGFNDLLRSVSGIDIRQRGANGMQADMSIRGGSFDQNLILLNGVNISDPQTGHHSLNLPIDLNSVGRIEILEGSGSRVFGPNAFSGAINVITNDFKENFTKAMFVAGDFGLFTGNLTTAYQFKQSKHFISLSKSQSNGFTRNTDFNSYNLFYNTKFQSEFGDVDFQIGYTNKQFGANSFYTPKYPDQFEHTKTTFTSLKFETGNKLKLSPVVYFRRHQDRFEMFRYNSPDWYSGHNYHLTDVYGVNLNARLITGFGTTSIGAEIRSENIWSNVLGNPMNDTIKAPGEQQGFYTRKYTRTISNYYLEHSYYFGNFSISGGLLASWVSENDFDFNYYPGIEMSYQLMSSLRTYMSVNKSLRLPTFTDLFYNGPENIGNPDLKPEEALSYEWGIKLNSLNIASDLALFYRDASNVIAWVRESPANEGVKWETNNLTEVATMGFQINNTIKLNLLTINSIQCNYTFIGQSVFASEALNTKYSLNYLKHNLYLGINHQLFKNLNFKWVLSYRDRAGSYPKYFPETGLEVDQNFEPYVLVDLKMVWKYKYFSFFAEATNLFNADYVEIGNIDMPGRWFKAGVNVRIGY